MPENVYHHIMNQSYHDIEAQWYQFSLKYRRKPFALPVASALCQTTGLTAACFFISLVKMQFYHLPSAICCLAALFSLKGRAFFSSWCSRSDPALHLEHLYTKHTFGTDPHHTCVSPTTSNCRILWQYTCPLTQTVNMWLDRTAWVVDAGWWRCCRGCGADLSSAVWTREKAPGSGVSVASVSSRLRTKCSCLSSTSVNMVNIWDAVWHLKS